MLVSRLALFVLICQFGWIACGLMPAAHAAPVTHRLKLPVQCVLVADDDGSRATATTSDQIQKWIDFANQVYAPIGLELEFVPQRDITRVNSTLLNNMFGIDDANWRLEKARANAIAAQHPGKITVFFRHGPGTQPTGQGFSSYDYDFIAMPGFDAASHCGHAHTDAFAHELGHYLGLMHTFPAVYDDMGALEKQLSVHAGNPKAFDGDRLSDTLPDPLLRVNECSHVEDVFVSGQRFVLPRRNVMSYYDERDEISPQQQARAKWFLDWRYQHHMSVPINSAADMQEVEAMHVVTENCSTTRQAMDEFGKGMWSAGAQAFGYAKSNCRAIFNFSVANTGDYNVVLYATKAPDFGMAGFALDGQLALTSADLYGAVVVPTGPVNLGTCHLNAGEHKLIVNIYGKNLASSGYCFGIDGMCLQPR